MRISLGARPNFINPSNHIDCLSTGLFLFEGTFDYIRKLFDKCPNLITIGFQYPGFLKFTLFEINAGSIQLPLLRVIKLEESQYLRSFAQILQELVQYEKSIEPERLQFVYNDHPISLEQFASIVQVGKKFRNLSDKPNNSLTFYLKFLKENSYMTALSCLCWGTGRLLKKKDGIELDVDLVMKLKNLQMFALSPGSPRIGEAVFRTMLTTWTKLNRLYISEPSEQVGQHLLNQMPDHWPNLGGVRFDQKPDDLKFLVEFTNLKGLVFKFILPKEETMFLIRSCPSLYSIIFRDESAGFNTAFNTKKRWKYYEPQRIYLFYFTHYHPIRINKYVLFHYPVGTVGSKCYTCTFDYLSDLLSHYYKNDISRRYYHRHILDKIDKTDKKICKFWKRFSKK